MAEGLQYAGDFEIEECRLITTTGMEIDLNGTGSIMGLTLFEDIFSTTIAGTITIQDSVNMVSHGPIIGQEYLHLKIKTPTFTEDGDGVIDFSKNAFIVNSISKRMQITNNIQGFSLSFVSLELVRNQRLKVTQSLTASWSDIVKKMLVDYLETKKKVVIEESAGIKKFVAPNMRPLDIITLGAKQAIGKNKPEPTYLFYETLKGFNFRTLASLYDRPSLLEYVTVITGSVSDAGIINVLTDMQTIQEYEIIANNDSLVNYRTGMFGSKLITHDIISKSYETKTYNYHDNFQFETHIAGGETKDYPLASDISVNDKELRVSDFPARTFLMPTSLTGGVDSQHTTENNTNPYMAYDPHKWVQRRTSQMVQLENALQVNILVNGNTLINAGDKVTVNLPYTAVLKSPENRKFDRFYNGPFLIKKIRHDFIFTTSPKKHQMYIQLVKDSLKEKLNAADGNTEPDAPEPAEIEDYEYLQSVGP